MSLKDGIFRICADLGLLVNDGEFRRAQKDFESFITELTTLVVEKDATIPELPSKDIVSFGHPAA